MTMTTKPPEPSAELEPAPDNRVCQICDGGPGNECACDCGLQKWETPELVETAFAEREAAKDAEIARLYSLAKANNDLARHEAAGRKEASAAIAALRAEVAELVGALAEANYFVGWATTRDLTILGVRAVELTDTLSTILAKHGASAP